MRNVIILEIPDILLGYEDPVCKIAYYIQYVFGIRPSHLSNKQLITGFIFDAVTRNIVEKYVYNVLKGIPFTDITLTRCGRCIIFDWGYSI